MKRLMKSNTRRLLRQAIACLTAFMVINGPVWASVIPSVPNPNISGSVNLDGGITTTVNIVNDRTIINWNSLDTNWNDVLKFVKDTGNFAVLNRVVMGGATQFNGKLDGSSRGHIIIVNPNGIVFGPTAEVTAHRFTASTLEIQDSDFLNDNLTFETGSARGRITLAAGATIEAERVELLAHRISNSGAIVGGGDIVLLATGDKIFLASDSDDIVVEIALPNTSAFTYTIANEASGTIQNDTGKVILAAGDTFAQALTHIHNQAFAVSDYNVEQRGTIQADVVEMGAAQQIALRAGGATEADTLSMAAQKIDIRQSLDTVGDMTIDSDYHISASAAANLRSGGNMSLVGHQTSVYLLGEVESEGTLNIEAGTNLTLFQGASSEDTMTLSAGDRIISFSDLESQADMTLTANETMVNADIRAASDLAIHSDLLLFGDVDQTLVSSGASVRVDGAIHKPTDGSIYIAAENNVRLDGDVQAEAGGVSVISKRGRIHTGAGSALNVAIRGYSDDIGDDRGADLPFLRYNSDTDTYESQGKAAVVLQSYETLILGPSAVLEARGTYEAGDGGADDRRGVNFLDIDAVIGGHDRDKGTAIDVAIYAASTSGNVIVNGNAAIIVNNDSANGAATVVLDAYNTVAMPNAGVLSGGFRLEAASRICEWLYQAENFGRLPNLADVEAVLGEGNYVRRGAGQGNSQIGRGERAWVLENPPVEPDPVVAPLAALELPELKGCPVELQAAAIELGIPADTLQMTFRNALAMNPNIQPCEACASLVTAATILYDADGARLAAMNLIFNTLAPADAPFTPEVSASIVTAFAQLGSQDSQYALAAEYIDAFVRYVAVLDTELKAPVGDPTAFALAKHGQGFMSDEANPNIAAFILSQLMPEGI